MRNYWWLEITKDIGKYIGRCDMYQKMKNWAEIPAGKLIANKVPEKLWTHFTVDFIIKLPLVAKKDTILVICNRLSNITYFVAITEETSVEELI